MPEIRGKWFLAHCKQTGGPLVLEPPIPAICTQASLVLLVCFPPLRDVESSPYKGMCIGQRGLIVLLLNLFTLVKSIHFFVFLFFIFFNISFFKLIFLIMPFTERFF